MFHFLIIFNILFIGTSFRRLPNHHNDNKNNKNLNYTEYDDIKDEREPKYNIRIQRKITTAEQSEVINLPGLSKDIPLKHYAGHLYVDDHKKDALFYWLFEKPVEPEHAPLLVWLNGGPGCSSMDGLFLELGPLRLKNSDTVVINEYSWHNSANLLFIDQPIGTGLSFSNSKSYAKNDLEINKHFYKAMIEFFHIHNNYLIEANGRKRTRKFFMSGESHAGHYIPSMIDYILQMNDKYSQPSSTYASDSINPEGIIISIEGCIIGNGWVDPFHQYDVSDFAHGLGFITSGQRDALKQKEKSCQSLLSKKKYNSNECFGLLDDVIASTGNSASGHIVMYDARLFAKQSGVGGGFPPGHQAVETYLNRKDVREAIHATSAGHFEECADPPYNALSHQDGLGVTSELINILNRNIKVTMFSGQYDVICQHLGTEKLLNELQWKGQNNWLHAPTGIWVENSKAVGYIKSSANLQFLVVLNAGHMVPMDLPEVGLNMITKFLSDTSFATGGKSRVGVLVEQSIDNDESTSVDDVDIENSYMLVDVKKPLIQMNSKVQIRLSYSTMNKTVLGCEISVFPGNKVIYTNQESVVIDGLVSGTEYIFLVRRCYATQRTDNYFQCERNYYVALTSTPGCVKEDGYAQCCGHGSCFSGSHNQAPQCKCEMGYTGDYCQRYINNSLIEEKCNKLTSNDTYGSQDSYMNICLNIRPLENCNAIVEMELASITIPNSVPNLDNLLASYSAILLSELQNELLNMFKSDSIRNLAHSQLDRRLSSIDTCSLVTVDEVTMHSTTTSLFANFHIHGHIDCVRIVINLINNKKNSAASFSGVLSSLLIPPLRVMSSYSTSSDYSVTQSKSIISSAPNSNQYNNILSIFTFIVLLTIIGYTCRSYYYSNVAVKLNAP